LDEATEPFSIGMAGTSPAMTGEGVQGSDPDCLNRRAPAN
jgi:hypothetical protein